MKTEQRALAELTAGTIKKKPEATATASQVWSHLKNNRIKIEFLKFVQNYKEDNKIEIEFSGPDQGN